MKVPTTGQRTFAAVAICHETIKHDCNDKYIDIAPRFVRYAALHHEEAFFPQSGYSPPYPKELAMNPFEMSISDEAWLIAEWPPSIVSAASAWLAGLAAAGNPGA